MIPPSARRSANNKPRSLHVLLRNGDSFRGEAFLSDGHALGPYLSSRKGGWINVLKATWAEEGELHPHAVVQADDILFASYADGDGTAATVAGGGGREVDISLEDRTRIRGRIQLADRQRMSDYLAACGKFIPVLGAMRIPGDDALGDIALNAEAVRAVRDPRAFSATPLTPADAAREWGGLRRASSGAVAIPDTTPAATAGPAPSPASADQERADRLARHWLVRVAAGANLQPPEHHASSGMPAVEDVWTGLLRRNDLTETELAVLIVEAYKLPLADLDAVNEVALDVVPEKLARKLGVLPLRADGGTLTVAVSDPASLDIETQLAFITRLALRFEVASPNEIRGATDWHYGQRAVRASTPWLTA